MLKFVSVALCGAAAICMSHLCSMLLVAYAQIPGSPITSSGLSTQISAPIAGANGTTQFNITGGSRPGNGANLFHSFGEFRVPTNNIANFLNDAGLPTSNILGRVTGGNPSNIFGTIQTTGFGNANLFLMNPAGIVFGPTASLNVGGSVSFTTADYLRLADGARFNALPGPQDASISSAPVAAFGFLGSNPGAITVQGSQLAVSEGGGISFVGGSIEITAAEIENGTLQRARVSAPAGQINLVSTASPGEVVVSNYQPEPNMALGPITLSQGTILDVSADAAGMVRIRGGQLIMDNATISADTVNANGSSVAIDINIAGDMSISTTDVAALTARTTGSGNAGKIQIQSWQTDISAISEEGFSVIDSHTSGIGKAGDVSLTSSDLNLVGDPVGLVFIIDSGTTSEGSGGNVAINARTITMLDSFINSGDTLVEEFRSSGRPGDVSLAADTIDMTTSGISAETFLGPGADITMAARDIRMDFSTISAVGFEGSGAIKINGDRLLTIGTQLGNQVLGSTRPGGDIVLNGKEIELTGGTVFSSSTFGDAAAGAIRVNATDHFTLSGSTFGLGSTPTGLLSNSFGTEGILGNAGSIFVTTPRLDINGGARISTITRSSGVGGNVNIDAETVTMSGQLIRPTISPFVGLGNRLAGGVVTSTIGDGTLCSGSCGNAGNVSITTGSLTIGAGSQIDSGTRSTGRGGDLFISARDSVSISGTLTDGTPVGIFTRTVGAEAGSGEGGNISLTAGQSVALSNGASISASSTGPANAGNIVINAGSQFLSQNGFVTTQASQASGGNITIQATDSIRLVNSQLSTSVQGGPNTTGGNILLDPAIVTLQNSQVTAQAFQGQGGNINIIAGTFLADPTSVVSASSQFGLSGTVNIQSPVSSLSNTLATLPQRPLQAQNLLTQRCAAQLNGQLSSLVVTGRDALPVEPGGWLMSPLALMADDEAAPQAHLATSQTFEPSYHSLGPLGQLPDQHDSSSQRGVWDRETGCGS